MKCVSVRSLVFKKRFRRNIGCNAFLSAFFMQHDGVQHMPSSPGTS